MEASSTYGTQTPVKAFSKAPRLSEMDPLERPSFDEVKEVLAGQTLVIPNLRPIFQHWPRDVNPALSRLQKAVFDGIENCWPDADFDTLSFMAHLVLWAWYIEGYTDNLVADEAAAHGFRSEAKKSRQLLLDELFTYLEGTELEAKMRSRGQMPSYDRYLSMRTSANGSGFFLVVSAAADRDVLAKCPRWLELKKTAATINFLVNDLLSAKREFKTGEYLNSVILRAYDLDSVDAGVAECIARIKGLVQEFDHQAKAILDDTSQVGNVRSSAAGAIETMRSFNVGSLEWRQVCSSPKQAS
ncbi:Presilphiperfolan-8-beta-ol synthase [Apiospora phragmitis]|uniref:Presilphiperfolan-8-beta-ol synthase n=1 Tax=Apiospora phragmitis TaxID=2905665 RepID=A0ABR1SV77_9PEZI